MSAWTKGVKEYANDLIEHCKENNLELTEKNMLNGAKDWKEFSYGGSSLIYDWEIAERLCTKTELKRTKGGERPPNKREQWLDVQARALNQACILILQEVKKSANKE